MIWRDRNGGLWEEMPDDTVRYIGPDASVADAAGHSRLAVERVWGPLTRETPRTWELPPEPGPEVRAVRTAMGSLYLRTPEGWRYEEKPDGSKSDEWRFLIHYGAPLTDATAEVTESAPAT